MKTEKGTRIARLGLAGVLVLGCGVAFAQDNPGPPAPAARAVRLSSVDGKVQISQGGQMLTDQAVANTPLFEGTKIATGNDGRAEVQFEDGSVARLTPDTSMTLSLLKTGGETDIVLNNGLGFFELQGANQEKPTRVRFGDNVATASGFTVIRISLDQAPGELAVFSGNAHLDAPANVSLDLHGGQSIKLDPGDPSNSNVADSIEPDSWDAWNSDRDQALTASAAGSTPPAQDLPNGSNPAWGDLNANGAWYNVPDQGYVWSPYEASNSGWDPYGNGYWMQEPSYGTVWVSGEPWGYMPYQCGLWNYYNSFGWGWAPGTCNTWWGRGWGFNLGTVPPWYHRPFRPRHPFNPRPGAGGGHTVVSTSLIAVNRHVPGGAAMLPQRDRNLSVNIAGNLVEPLRTAPSRPQYNHIAAHGNRMEVSPRGVVPAMPANPRPGYNRPPDSAPRSSYVPQQRTAPAPVENSRPQAGAPRPSGGSHFGDGGGRAPSAPPPSFHSAPSAPPASHSAPAPSGGSHR